MKWLRKKKPNRRLVKEERKSLSWRPVLAYSLGALMATAVGASAFLYLGNIEWEKFRALEVTGDLEKVSPAEVHAVLQPFIASGFARIDLHAAQQSLESLAWVADAKVRRQWPGELVVHVREERPVATWFGTSLMNAQGKVFVDGAAGFNALPDIGGPAGTQDDMIQRMNEIRAAMQAEGLELRRLLRTDRRAERLWLAVGDAGLIEVRLGRSDTDARLQRFLESAWPVLAAQAPRINYIDMRYTNGFAVGWKEVMHEARQERG